MVTRVWLRPLEEADLALFDQAFSSPEGAGEYQWFGFSSPGRSLREMGALDGGGGRLTAMADDRVVGSVFWCRREWGLPETSWCWEVGLHLHADERGRGLGSRCLRLLSGYLFDHTLAWRLQAITDVRNVAAHRVLDRAGYVREGRRRGPQWREGRWHDHFLYSRLRDDPPIAG